MLAIFICSHSDFSTGLKKSAEMIAGPLDFVEAFSLWEGESLESLAAQIREKYDFYHSQQIPVVCLCDLENATQYNACIWALSDTHCRIFAGATLPLVLELALGRDMAENLDEFLDQCLRSAQGALNAIGVQDFLTAND